MKKFVFITLSPLVLVLLATSCHTQPNQASGELRKTPTELNQPAACFQEKPYKVDFYIKTAMALQSLGHVEALRELDAMAQDESSSYRVYILCRMLFAKRSGSEFRRPMIGAAEFLGGTDYSDWPLEPIALVDGVPFLIVRGYFVAGEPEQADWYLRYCETNCDWSSFRFTNKTEQQKSGSVESTYFPDQMENSTETR